MGVTAISLLRIREHLGNTDLREIRQLAKDAISDRDYEVVWQTSTWELIDREQARAIISQQLRFIRNNISVIGAWSGGDGKVEKHRARWRRSDKSDWTDATWIHELGVRGGKKILYSFNQEHNRGDMLEWCVERDTNGRFPKDQESVSLEARTSADHPRAMKIVWPIDHPPKRVELRHGDQPAREVDRKKQGDGRVYVEEKIARQGIGETVTITWAW